MAVAARIGGRAHHLRWQIVLGFACALAFGALQGTVASAVGRRRAAPPLATALYILDLNVAVLVLAAIALEEVAGRMALARHNRRFLKLEARLLEARHDVLTLQLQPHFLFNALNSVAELVREAPREAARVLRNLGTLFLATTRRSALAAVTLEEELDVVDAYIGVVRARHADTLTVTRTIDDAVRNASIPPLSLQPLVENAIQFALQAEGAARRVALDVALLDGRLHVRVTNGRSQRSRPSHGLGIGLRNTRERLAHLFGADHALTLTLEPERAIAELDAPFIPLVGDAAQPVPNVTDEFAVPGEAPRPALPGLPRRIAALHPAAAIVGFWTLAWLFWVVQMHLYRMAREGTLTPAFTWSLPDLVSALSWMAITPAALLLGRRVPVRGPRWPAALAVHVAGALAATAVNVGLVAVVVGLAMVPVANVLNQVVVNCAMYALIVLWCHAESIARWFDERQTATRRLEAELARARWEATEMRLNPERIAEELERLAALVAVDAAGAEDQVLDMADTLRRRLEGVATGAEARVRQPGALAAPLATVMMAAALVLTACTPSRAAPPPPAPAAATSATSPPAAPPNPADVHFMTGMIGHHAQALVMAGWAPSHGASASLRTLAERIINEQRDEIATMQRWLRDRGLPVPEAKPEPMHMTMDGMDHEMRMPGMLTDAQMRELDAARGTEFDRLFLTYMIQHHEGAVSMVRTLFGTDGAAQDQAVFKIASDVSADQTSEITRMRKMLASLTITGG
jgi:uncharacterized protein (DUF305 family)